MDDIITEHSGAVLRVELNRPTKRNAMTSGMYVTLADVFKDAAKDENTRVVLWHGAGDSFCAGNDVEDFLKNPPAAGESPQARLMNALLDLDKQIGSIEKGKDADVVLWSGNPFSVYSRAEKVWVDGAMLFDRLDPAQLGVHVAGAVGGDPCGGEVGAGPENSSACVLASAIDKASFAGYRRYRGSSSRLLSGSAGRSRHHSG